MAKNTGNGYRRGAVDNRSQGVQESEAIKLMSEYQLARASAPLIPTWLWNRMEGELNATWKQYRR